MREGLREIAQVLAARAKFLGIEAEVIGIPESLFKEKPRFVEVTGPPQTLDVPECAHTERAFLPGQAV